MKRILVTVVLLSLAVGFAWAEGQGEASGEAMEEYPSKPVTIIVPWNPGGGTDILVRGILTVMGNYFPEPMVVVNRPGGGGTIGTTEGLMAPADGYTLVITGYGPTVTQPFLKDLEYDEDDYDIVLQLNDVPRIMVAHPDTPYDTMEEMMEYAAANPGEVVNAIAAVGSTGHFGTAQLELDYGVTFTTVPQGGGGPQRVAVLGANSDIAPVTAPEGGPLVQQGQLKALCTMSAERFDELPDVPTCAEEGYAVNSGVAWHVYVPAGTPRDRIDRLHDAFKNAIEDPAFLPIAERLNLGIKYGSAEEARQQLEELMEVYERIASELDLAG